MNKQKQMTQSSILWGECCKLKPRLSLAILVCYSNNLWLYSLIHIENSSYKRFLCVGASVVWNDNFKCMNLPNVEIMLLAVKASLLLTNSLFKNDMIHEKMSKIKAFPWEKNNKPREGKKDYFLACWDSKQQLQIFSSAAFSNKLAGTEDKMDSRLISQQSCSAKWKRGTQMPRKPLQQKVLDREGKKTN